MKRKWKSVFAVVALAVVIIFLYQILSVADVEVVELKKTDTELNVVCSGIIEPEKEIQIIFDQAVIVDSVFVETGDNVKKGDKIFSLSSAPKNNPYSENGGETVYSPCDGIIGELTTVEGMRYSEFKSLGIILNTEHLYVKAYVTENDINKLKIGQNAVADCCACESDYTCKIQKIYSSVVTLSNNSLQSNYFTVLLSIDKADEYIIPGFSSTVTITVNRFEKAITVPESAIFAEKGQNYVYRSDNGTIVKSRVVVSISTHDGVLISHGLNENEIVVFDADSVEEGDRIREVDVVF